MEICPFHYIKNVKSEMAFSQINKTLKKQWE